MQKMKFFLLILIFIQFSFAIDKEKIKSSPDFYSGTGFSENAREAKDLALAELTCEIAVRVQSSFSSKVKESGEELVKNVEAVLKSYSTAALKNVKAITTPLDDGRFEVFCYIEKGEVLKIFASRKNLIAEMVAKAEKYLKERNISYALKQLYFAGVLLLSLPDENVIIQGRNYTTDIPVMINRTILKIKFAYLGDKKISPKERTITLSASYEDQPIALLDFSFWDGANQVAVRGKNGEAIFTLFGSSTVFDELKLNIKYSFYESRKEYAPVADLWDLVDRPSYKAGKTVQLKVPVVQKPPVEKKKIAKAPVATCGEKFEIDFKDIPAPKEKIVGQVCKFIGVIREKKMDKMAKQLANDPFLKTKLSRYMKFNHPRFPEKLSASINETAGGYELRRFTVQHNYPSMSRQTTEYIVLDFDTSGKLIDFNLTITDFLYQRFVTEAKFGNDWGKRQAIIKFIEKYRTAYLTRDMPTIDLMYADEALIIIGREIKKKILAKDMVKYKRLNNQPDIEYIRLSKKEYLKRQRSVFDNQQDIFLDFGSFDIFKKNNAPKVYGVEMRQSYASTTYADEGYLFLLMDFSGKDPLIYVRAWQPSAWSPDELIRTANFKIYK